MELFKHASDKLLIRLLKLTSGFAKELTREGRDEQRLWLEQRRHFLKGLAIMSQRRYAKSRESVK
jgi:hypothetical protein